MRSSLSLTRYENIFVSGVGAAQFAARVLRRETGRSGCRGVFGGGRFCLDPDLADFVNTWIDLTGKDQTIQALYDCWILGRSASAREPCWCTW